MSDMSDISDRLAEAGKVKHTILWDPDTWEATERAAARLAEQTGAEVTVPNYIRGTIERRNREILGNAA